MGVTFLLLLWIICGVFLMLWAGVAFIQDKKYFTSAPKDVQAAILPHAERFPGAHALGWFLMAVAAVLVIGSVIFAFWDGIRRGYPFGPFFLRFLILLEGAADQALPGLSGGSRRACRGRLPDRTARIRCA